MRLKVFGTKRLEKRITDIASNVFWYEKEFAGRNFFFNRTNMKTSEKQKLIGKKGHTNL